MAPIIPSLKDADASIRDLNISRFSAQNQRFDENHETEPRVIFNDSWYYVIRRGVQRRRKQTDVQALAEYITLPITFFGSVCPVDNLTRAVSSRGNCTWKRRHHLEEGSLRLDELLGSNGGGRPASQAYWNALRKLRDAWREVFGEELEAHGSRAMETFENAVENLKERLRQDAAGGKRLLEVLDVQPGENIEEVLLGWADLDDLTPNRIKAAMLAEFQSRGEGRFELRLILRAVFDVLFDDLRTRRPRVGPNRHWPRLLQYLRELEEATDRSPDGRGVRLANIGGRGPVAREPRDPGLLSVIVDPGYL